MRILDKYLLKELSFTFVAVLLVLLLITFGAEVTQLLASAIEGKLPASIVLDVLLLKIPKAFELILPLVSLLSVMLVLGRLYQDQEMVVLNSCGIGGRYFRKVLLAFLIPMGLFTAWVTLWLAPWATQQERLLILEAQTTSPVAGLVAGRFNPLPQSQGVLYASQIDADGGMQDVWIQMNSDEQSVVLVAEQGRFEWLDGRLALVLRQGYSYQGLTRGDQLQVQSFERFDGFLPDLAQVASTPGRHEMSSWALLQSSDFSQQAAFQWRIAIPFSVVVLGMLALKLSKTKPREGRFARMFFAIVLYVVFMQAMMMIEDWMKAGQWPVLIGFWPLLIGFLLIGRVDLTARFLRLKS